MEINSNIKANKNKIIVAKESTNSKLLLEFVEDPDYKVREAITENQNCPDYVLKRIFEYEEKNYFPIHRIVYNIIMHKNCPNDNIVEFVKKYLVKYYKIYGPLGAEEYIAIIKKLTDIISSDDCDIKILQDLKKMDTINHSLCRMSDETTLYYQEVRKAEKKLFKIVSLKLLKLKILGKIKKDNRITEKELLRQKNKLLEQKKEQELEKQKEIENIRNSLIKNLSNVKELSDRLYSEDIKNRYKINYEKRVTIPENELLIRFPDHTEINPRYLDYINYIDFSFIITEGLKVNGIDFSGTNISINPQTVYLKDLSNSKFSDDNIILKSFAGCNLSGCDISEETESIGIEEAITDENTVVPRSNLENKNKY